MTPTNLAIHDNIYSVSENIIFKLTPLIVTKIGEAALKKRNATSCTENIKS